MHRAFLQKYNTQSLVSSFYLLTQPPVGDLHTHQLFPSTQEMRGCKLYQDSNHSIPPVPLATGPSPEAQPCSSRIWTQIYLDGLFRSTTKHCGTPTVLTAKRAWLPLLPEAQSPNLKIPKAEWWDLSLSTLPTGNPSVRAIKTSSKAWAIHQVGLV